MEGTASTRDAQKRRNVEVFLSPQKNESIGLMGVGEIFLSPQKNSEYDGQRQSYPAVPVTTF
jgi:hypothetical protein